MKIIKSSLLIAAGLCMATWANAQQQTAKPIETPPVKQDLKPVPKEVPVDAVQAAPSPLKRDENTKALEKENTPAMLKSDTKVSTPGGPQQAKILAGASEKPGPVIVSPSTIDPKALPAPAAKPAVIKQQQNQ